ncbi:MAG: glutaredoxin family protein [Thermodesulfovibrionales bacterium]|nr:glutaredoxin family protein [Thermodesulfovibrionales bacterium]
MVHITFYHKPECWLCDLVQEMLNGLEEKYSLYIKKIDITTDNELYELYRHDIPVLEFKDGTALHGRIRLKDLLQKIGENKE